MPTDDQPDNIQTTAALKAGEKLRASINHYGDSDWIRVQLTAGQTYVFTLVNSSAWPADTISLFLRDGNGSQLQSRDGFLNSGIALEYTAALTGVYYLDIRAPNAFPLAVIDYDIGMDLKPAGDDFAASSATTGSALVGAEMSGIINNRGDVDWFKFNAEAGKTYALAPVAGNPNPITLSVTDASGNVVAKNGESFTATTAGQYYVNVSGYKTGAYSFSLGLAQDDYAGDMTTSATLPRGTAISAAANYVGDSDWYRVALDAHTFYTFDLKRGYAESDSLTLRLLRGDGTELPFKAISNLDGSSSLTASVSSPGDYYVAVGYSNYYSGNPAKPYTVTFTDTVVKDDFGDTAALATPFALDTQVTGELTGGGDIDVLKLHLRAGIMYSFDLKSLSTAYLSADLYGGYLDSLAWATHTLSTEVNYTPLVDGSYTLHIKTLFDKAPSAHSPYTIKVAQVVDDYPGNASTSGKVVPGGYVTGMLLAEGGDKDWFAMDLKAGVTYFLKVDPVGASSGGAGANATLTMIDAAGIRSPSSMAGTGLEIPQLSFTPASSGKYFAEVATANALSGQYKLSLVTGSDDVGNDITRAQKLPLGSSVQGTLEAAGDLDFFAISRPLGQAIVVQYEREPGIEFWDSHLLYTDANGVNIGTNGGSQIGSMATHIFDGFSSLAYVYARGFGKASTPYSIKTFALPADDYGDETTTTAKITAGGTVSGSIDYAGDVDAFQAVLEKGQTYVFDLYGAASAQGSFDASRQMSLIVMANGGHLTRQEQAIVPAEGRFIVQAQYSGVYSVLVQNAGTGRGTGTYKVTMDQLTGDLTAPKLVTAPAASIGFNGNLSLGFDELVQFNASKIAVKDIAGNVVLDSSLLGVSALHETLTIDPAHFLTPGAEYSLEIAPGGVSDLAGNPVSGALSFKFSTHAASAAPGSGADLIVVKGHGNVVDGGAGVDTVMLPALYADYQIIALPDGRTQLLPKTGGASDVLRNVERVFFADKAVALDVSGNGGAVYRLYQAAFDRTPDGAGLGYWIGQVDKGAPMRSVAQAFVGSAEFAQKYGSSTTNAEFIDLLYANVLHRGGDAAGVAYWNKVLDGGMAREQVLMSFSDSTENVAAVASVVGAGFEYLPF